MKRSYKIYIIICVMLVVAGYFGGKQLHRSNDHSIKTSSDSLSQNEFSTLNYYQQRLLPHYEQYRKKHPEMSVENIVTYVNIGLDQGFYPEPKDTVKNPNNMDVLVNKFHSLPLDWQPQDLVLVNENRKEYVRKPVANAFWKLQEACKKKGFSISAYSGYRSFSHQLRNYANMVNVYGQEYTDKYVSHPGHSEHTTGLCIDISIDDIPYEQIETSPHYPWFYNQLTNYGFILRYPKDKQDITGYHYESWHIRYVGKSLAKKVTESNLTFDEYMARQPK